MQPVCRPPLPLHRSRPPFAPHGGKSSRNHPHLPILAASLFRLPFSFVGHNQCAEEEHDGGGNHHDGWPQAHLDAILRGEFTFLRAARISCNGAGRTRRRIGRPLNLRLYACHCWRPSESVFHIADTCRPRDNSFLLCHAEVEPGRSEPRPSFDFPHFRIEISHKQRMSSAIAAITMTDVPNAILVRSSAGNSRLAIFPHFLHWREPNAA